MRITAQNPITIQPQLADFLSKLEVGDSVKGKILEMLGQSISIKTASGQVFTAALMKAAELEVGQMVELNINSITAEGVFAELKAEPDKQTTTGDAKLQQLLKQMDIKPEEPVMQAAKLLVKYSMPVTKENVLSLMNTQKSIENLAQGDAAKAVALMQAEANVNDTEVVKLVKQTAVLEPESQQIVRALAQESTPIPTTAKAPTVNLNVKPVIISAQPEEAPVHTSNTQPLAKPVNLMPQSSNEKVKADIPSPKAVMQQLTEQIKQGMPEVVEKEMPKLEKLMDNILKVFETVAQAKPEQTAYLKSKQIEITPASIKALFDNVTGTNQLSTKVEGFEKLIEALEKYNIDVKDLKQEVKKLFLKPEALKDKEQITENFKEILKTGAKLESIIRENGLEHKLDTSVLQDIRNNIDFTKSINNNINYLQIPIQVNENKTTAEIYVYSGKKKSKEINPQNATILLALDLNRLGHLESLISVNKKDVNVTFRVEKEEFKKLISSNSEALREALEARGYRLKPLNIIQTGEKFNLLELEELTNVGTGQLHVDVKV